ncbi:Cyclic di-GMP phosphodiesterase CdgJ [Vibrio sp. 16]|nr:Cyclic di-GMP phosphodiesterase CdgJ [Vibrio sp. 16]
MVVASMQTNLDTNTYIARQPILEVDGNVFGYELLYRNSMANCYPQGVADTEATARMYAEHFLGDIVGLLGKTPAFINFDYDSLLNGAAMDFPPQAIVVEILETCSPTEELFEVLSGLKSQGYTLALDDFTPSDEWQSFYPLIDIIKFDIQSMSMIKCGLTIRSLQGYDIRFLAEKVESYDEFEAAKKWGFELFQGYFFTKPQLIKRTRLSSSTETLVSLSKLIASTPLDYNKITNVINQSASLSYQLLRYVNNAGLVGDITSVKQALAYLGDSKVVKYCSYALLSQLGSEKPPVLQLFALRRARLMYLTMRYLNQESLAEQAYLTGLLSLTDAMLDMNIEDIGQSLKLDSAITSALVHHSGKIGATLQITKWLETNDWVSIEPVAKQLQLSENDIIALAVESDLWICDVY